MSPGFEIQLIAVFVAVACALPGVFLVLRKMSMMTDSITHTILLGIVLAFFLTHDLSSPLLIIGAAAMGVITVWLTEMLHKTKLVSEDAAIGVIFPLLFSIAIILITRYSGSIHLDTDSVLLGELAFAPFNRMVIGGVDIGAKSIYTSGILLILNIVLITLFFKELKLSVFDPLLATALGFSPVLLHYGLMTLVSLTAVGAFEAVGSVLVVAFMIGPGLTAYLLTDSLRGMLFLSGIFASASAILGYQAAVIFDVSIAGCMAVAVGILFIIVFLFSPKQGFIMGYFKRIKQKKGFAQDVLMLHIFNHQGTAAEDDELGVETMHQHLYWKDKRLKLIARQLEKESYVYIQNYKYQLTESGIARCKDIENSLL